MNTALRYITFGNSINIIADNLLIPVFAIFVTDVGGGIEMAGILFGVKFLASMLAGLLLTNVRDNKALDYVFLRYNFLLKTIAWGLVLIAPSLISLFIAQAIIGAASGFGAPAFDSLVSDHLDAHRHISEWSDWHIIMNMAILFGTVSSGFIVARYGFGVLFGLMAGLQLGSFLFFSLPRVKYKLVK